jgi:Fanconi anemia group M protein
MIFDIFSKSKKQKTIKQHKIIADIHEKNSLVIPSLHELEADIEIKSLKVGDYIINNTIIERKTISDFISSMISKRLIQQLLELQRYGNRILIIEGKIDEEQFNPNAIRGMILSIELELKIPIIFTQDSEETAKYLLVLARKQDKTQNFSLHSKKGQTKQEIQKYIIESFPGIGPKTAKLLLKKLNTIKNIINTPITELEKLIGKKSEVFKILEEKY